MIIAQISDTHIDLDGPKGPARIRDLELCVDDINRLDPPPDAVIHTGDLVQNGSPAEYREAARILGALSRPLHVAAGNRDASTRLRGSGKPSAPDITYGSIYESAPEAETVVGLQQKFLYLLTLVQQADARPTAQALSAVEKLQQRLQMLARRWEDLR